MKKYVERNPHVSDILRFNRAAELEGTGGIEPGAAENDQNSNLARMLCVEFVDEVMVDYASC